MCDLDCSVCPNLCRITDAADVDSELVPSPMAAMHAGGGGDRVGSVDGLVINGCGGCVGDNREICCGD